MKSHDEDEETASAEELREAAALAAALEGDAAATANAGVGAEASGVSGVSEALEAAAMLRNARTPLVVPAAHEAIVTTHAAPALDARRVRRSHRARRWIATSLAATAAAGWLLFATTLNHRAPSRLAAGAPLPPAPADLLAAQAEAARGGSQTRAALAALDLKMRDYRRQYQQSLGHRRGREP
jgi:hypothetical protein